MDITSEVDAIKAAVTFHMQRVHMEMAALEDQLSKLDNLKAQALIDSESK